MLLYVAFHDLGVLEAAPLHALASRYPHLRLVSLLPATEVTASLEALPAHVRCRVLCDPPHELLASGSIEFMLTSNRDATQELFPDIVPTDIVTWDELAAVYRRWLVARYLPSNARESLFTPLGLLPINWRPAMLTVEIIGSCAGEDLHRAVPLAAQGFPGSVESFFTVKNFPSDELPSAGDRDPSVRVLIPPLKYMHPETLIATVDHTDPDQLLAETCDHMRLYVDSAAANSDVPLFVVGFIEPYMNPMGSFFHSRRPSNLKYFIRCLNDVLVEWCEEQSGLFFVDANEIASAIGKSVVDEGIITYFAHRGTILPGFDDERDVACPTVPAVHSFEARPLEYHVAILREVFHRALILEGRNRVKAVVVDLDNTVWRGLASDGEVGSWWGRPMGLVEALKILKRRGIFVAIASKNDESYIREHWSEILYEWSSEPTQYPLSLEDFDVVKIDFRPKSVTIGEIVTELNVLPESVIFIDDNPLEREEVQSAFPEMRVLGAEMNYVRRELLHSPFTQSDVVTMEDQVRSATVRQQARLQKHVQAGTAAGFLHSLGLVADVSEVADPDSAAATRAAQLINKTNQWNLNGERVAPGELTRRLVAGDRLYSVEARGGSGSYGIVGAALVDIGQGLVTHLVVSCRVIGMGIDDAFMSEILARTGSLVLDYRDSGRNRATAAALQRWTGEPVSFRPVTVKAVEVPQHVRIGAGVGA